MLEACRVAGVVAAGLAAKHGRVGGQDAVDYRDLQHAAERVERAFDGGRREPPSDQRRAELPGFGACDGADRAGGEGRQHVPGQRALPVRDRPRREVPAVQELLDALTALTIGLCRCSTSRTSTVTSTDGGSSLAHGYGQRLSLYSFPVDRVKDELFLP